MNSHSLPENKRPLRILILNFINTVVFNPNCPDISGHKTAVMVNLIEKVLKNRYSCKYPHHVPKYNDFLGQILTYELFVYYCTVIILGGISVIFITWPF